MTISSTTRKAGPFNGTGIQTAYPFSFKVFAASDMLVVQTDAAGVETTLALTTNYTVALNADQDASPGGTVNVLAAPPAGAKLTVGSVVLTTQGQSIPNQGGFYPKVVEQSLDKLTINVQQLAEAVSRSFKLAFSDTGSANLPAAAARANKLLSFDASGNPVAVAATSGSATDLQLLLGGSSGTSLVGFLQAGVGAVLRTLQKRNEDYVCIFDFMTVAQIANVLAGTLTVDVFGACQAAINTGKKVRAPSGKYRLSAGLTLQACGGIIGEGENTQFTRFFTGGQVIKYPGGSQLGDPITLRDFAVTKGAGIVVADGDTGIDLGYSVGWGGRGDIHNIMIKDQWDGLKWKGGSTNPIREVFALENKGNGFFGVDARGELSDCLSIYNAQRGYYILTLNSSNTGIQFNSCGTFANQGAGFEFATSGGATGANIFLKGISSSADGGGGVLFTGIYGQCWLTQVLVESAGDCASAYPGFVNVNNAKGMYFAPNCERMVGSDIYIKTCLGGGLMFDGNKDSSFSNVTVIDNGRGLLGGADQVGVNVNGSTTNLFLENLICNIGMNQTADISLSSAAAEIDFGKCSFRTIYDTSNTGARFLSLPRTTAATSVASASVPRLPKYADFITITGTTAIDALTASWAGRRVTLKFAGALLMNDANNLRLSGNFSTTADDTITLICDGATWFELSRSVN